MCTLYQVQVFKRTKQEGFTTELPISQHLSLSLSQAQLDVTNQTTLFGALCEKEKAGEGNVNSAAGAGSR